MKIKKPSMEIGQRLKEFRERTKIKMPTIALATGITKENLYKWEKGTKPSDVNDFLRVKSFLDRMEMKEDELQMKFEMQKPHTLQIPLSTNLPPAFNTENNLASGTVCLINEEPHIIAERMNAPFLGQLEGAVEVNNDSMSPTIQAGTRIAIRRLTDLKLLDGGGCYYIINKNLTGMARRVYPCEGGIRLVADHPDQTLYPPMERRWEQILAVLEIVGTVNKL